jgi:sulfite exporter TauE/SafE
MIADLPLIFVGGLLGSSHCVGMCGGFALSVGVGSPGVARNLARQVSYSAGRVFTYAILGAFAGFAGLWLSRKAGTLVHAQAALSIAAGVVLIGQGMKSLGWVPGLGALLGRRATLPCASLSFFGPLLMSPRASAMFLAGVLNGLLPCGLVYAYLALASSGASLVGGVVTMAAFGLGTVPLMMLTGLGSSVLTYAARRRVLRVAAVLVLLTGFLALGRGVAFWHAGDSSSCPACAGRQPSLVSSFPRPSR